LEVIITLVDCVEVSRTLHALEIYEM